MRIAEISDWLDALLDTAQSTEIRSSERFHFGARQLSLITLHDEHEINYSAGLIPWESGSDGLDAMGLPVAVYLLPSSVVHSVPSFTGVQFGPYGSLVGLDAELDGRRHVGSSPRWLLTIDPEEGRLLALEVNKRVALLSSFSPLPPREIAELGRPLLHWLAILDGNVVMHAGAVSENGQGLLIAGAGNAGKTTFVRACVEEGMTLHGDNVIEVSPARDEFHAPQIWGAYKSLKIRPNPIGELPRGASTAWDEDASKTIHFLSEQTLVHARRPVVLNKILTLLPHGEPQFRSLSAASAFFATAPNTIAQFPYFEGLVLSRVRQTVESVPNITCGRIPFDTIARRTREVLA